MQSAPFIAVTGLHEDGNIQYFICCEQIIYLEAKKVIDAIVNLICMATYFIFNISYPKALAPVMIFFQHFVMDLRDDQSIPTSTVKLIGSLQII